MSGGAGSRTPVLSSFHISVYIISLLYSHNKQNYQNLSESGALVPSDEINSGLSSLSELSESIQLGNKVCITPAAYAAIAKLGSAIKGFNRLLYWATD